MRKTKHIAHTTNICHSNQTLVNGLLVGLVSCLATLVGCTKSESKTQEEAPVAEATVTDHDTYYHYSIWWAFVNKVFDADLSVKTLKENGDIGLGSFNKLDGEMVMVDGIAYRIREDGTVSEGDDSDTVVYANAAFFSEDMAFTTQADGNRDVEWLKSELLRQVPSSNFFYAFKIDGTFDYIKCGGLTKQEPPFEEGLDVLIPNRPVFEGNNVSGTIVGFYCPDFIGNINVKGFHFHFISEDKTLGGHVMDFDLTKALTVAVDKKTAYQFVLPDNEDFEQVSLEKEFQYKND